MRPTSPYFIGVVTALVASLFHTCETKAEPQVDYVQPASVARAQRGRLVFHGSHLDRPIGLWTSLPDGKLKVVAANSPVPDRCELDVELAADCPLGIYGLRLATEDGLSRLHLFAVDDIAPRGAASEPLTEFPVAIARAFRPAEVDRFPISVKAGQKLSFDVISSRLGTDADPLVTIFDPSGKRVFQRDNDPGIFFDCCFEYTFSRDGVYSVEVRDSRHLGAPHWQYVLRIGTFPAVHVALPSAAAPSTKATLRLPELGYESLEIDVAANRSLGAAFQAVRRPSDNASNWVPILVTKSPSVVEIEPNDSAESATPVSTATQAPQPPPTSTATTPATTTPASSAAPASPAPVELPILLHGTLARPKDRDYFALELKKGDRLFARAETKAINSAADVELIAVDATGREMQRVDDLNLPGGALDEAALTFNADKDGKYFLVVREATGASGAELSYRIDVQRVQPRITVVAEIASFAIPQDGYQSLPLTITRTDFTGPIELSLSGAPEGVTLEPNVVPEAANSLICRLQASASTPIGIRSFSIVARGKLPTPVMPMTPMPPTTPPPMPPAASPAKDAAAATGSAPTESYIETTVVAQPLVDKQFINVDLIRHALRDNQRWLPPSVKTQLALQITPPSPFRADPAEQIVTLPRYLQSPLVIRTPRDAAFTEPITFRSVGGGQFGDEAEGRRQMFARFPNATAADSQITATFHSRSQANDATERVDISATGRHGARSITLVRSITLQVRPAYELQFEPKQLTLAPGETAKVRLSVSRLPEFSGPVTVSSPTSPAPVGLNVPTMLTIAADQSAIDFEISAAADAKPRRDRLRFASNAQVGAFQEEPRPTELDVEIKMPPAAAPPAK